MSIISNLYPPIVLDTMPAFIRNTSCRVYFSLSNYNSIQDIKNVQFTLVNLKSNRTALDTENYPSGIKIVNLQQDTQTQDNFRYYITILPEDLEEGIFGLNQSYKVQLRFTSVDVPEDPPSNGKLLAEWLYNYRDYFSEWSSICLIKGIEQPHFQIKNLTEGEEPTTLPTALTDLVGRMYFDEQEQEYLQQYSIKIYNTDDLQLSVFESEKIYTNQQNPNEINYRLPYNFDIDTEYTLIISYATNNLYTSSQTYNFIIQPQQIQPIPATITATPREQIGTIEVTVRSDESVKFDETFVIKRTSSRTNFKIWDIIKIVKYEFQRPINYTWQDITIEGGVWYKYAIQKRINDAEVGTPIEINQPVMCVFEDIFLAHNDTQLRIKFNPAIGEFKYNVTESEQVTLGSKFPYVRRNGNNYFRSFTLSGLISSLSDRDDWFDSFIQNDNHQPVPFIRKNNRKFATKEELFGEASSLYDQYKEDNNVSDYLDILYEKAFREKVYDFLYANDVKLFKSTIEGNILVKVGNVSFQPIDTLGRQLYSFSATLTEIDEAEMVNYIKYGITSEQADLEVMTAEPAITKDRNYPGPQEDLNWRNTGILTIDVAGVDLHEGAITTTIDGDYLWLEELYVKGGRWK